MGEPLALWLFADPGLPSFNEEVRAEDIGHASTSVCGSKALVFQGDDDGDEVYVFAERVQEKDRAEWVHLKRTGGGRDPRLAKPHLDGDRVPRADLTQVVAGVALADLPGWPFEGPRAVADFLKGVQATGQSLLTFQTHWVKASGVHERCSAAIEHGVLLMLLHQLVTYDQVAVWNTAGGEQLVRRLLMIQRAVKKNPRSPSFDGLHFYLANRLGESGGILVKAFDRHVAELKKSDALILKQERLWREEMDHDGEEVGKQRRQQQQQSAGSKQQQQPKGGKPAPEGEGNK